MRKRIDRKHKNSKRLSQLNTRRDRYVIILVLPALNTSQKATEK